MAGMQYCSRAICIVGCNRTTRIASTAVAATLLFFRADLASSSCMLSRARGPGGYEFAYPSTWVFEKARGIEVLAHDPAMDEFNMSITTAPAERVRLGSVQEVGNALITRYKALPNVKQVELLDMDASEGDEHRSRRYNYEVKVVVVGTKPRYFAFGVLATDSKVYTLVLQVPEGKWFEEEGCVRDVVRGMSELKKN